MFGGDQIFFVGMMYFSGVQILLKGSHKSGGPINRNNPAADKTTLKDCCRPHAPP